MQGHSNGFKEDDFKSEVPPQYHVVFRLGVKRLETCTMGKEYMRQSNFNHFTRRSGYYHKLYCSFKP